MKPGERHNGFDWPLNWKQVVMWVYVIAITLSTYGLKFPILLAHYKSKLTQEQDMVDNRSLFAIVVLSFHLFVFSVFLGIVVYYNYLCTATSPTDPAIFLQR